jgi:formylglycine-generating enzyme
MGDDRGRADERPRHRVEVRGFLAATLPVTNADYRLYLEKTGDRAPPFWSQSQFNDPEQPVVGVSWHEAVSYCRWLSQVLGRSCRLPTEAEWEYGARGGLEAMDYAWGDLPLIDDGTSLCDVVQAQTWTAGTTPANGFGLQDMGFNVHEWCLDWYSPSYYAEGRGRDPAGPITGLRRVSRGGAWRHRRKVSRCAARSSLCPDFQYNDYGFRVFADG